MRSDVVVVGGGPSGAICARELARAGLCVVIIERSIFPRRKVCGEYLNCGSIEQLKSLGLYDGLAPMLNPLRHMHLYAAARSLQLSFPQAAAAIDRLTLDEYLLRAAVKTGVQVINGRAIGLKNPSTRITGIIYENQHGQHSIDTDFVIGADGCGSMVARELGFTLPLATSRRFALGGHFPCSSRDVLTMHVENSTYLATNPLSADRMNVMLVTPQSNLRSAAQNVDGWFEQQTHALQAPQAGFSAGDRIGPRVSIGPLTHGVRQRAGHGVLLVGDAAGFLNPFTGQGIFMALTSGRAAAATILATIARRTDEAKHFREYSRLQGNERYARSRLSTMLDILAHVPPLARRIMHRLESNEVVQRELLNLFCSISPPSIVRSTSLLVPLLV